MDTVIDNSAELSEKQVDQGVNSNNSYEELKQQVDKLKDEYNVEFGIEFDYFLFIDNSNHHLLDKHGEIMGLIKSNNDLDREEVTHSTQLIEPSVLNVKDLFSNFKDLLNKKTD